MKKPSRNVILLGFTSFFSDLASQMVYPLVPAFMETLGVSKTVIGAVEGLAEATASGLKLLSGWLSDRWGHRKVFVFVGYLLAALARPFLFFAQVWGHVMGIRFADRTGKAARGPARDAILADSGETKNRGRDFGFQRAMDRLGAVGGPLLALAILHFAPENLRLVFLLSLIPGLLGLAFIPFVKDLREVSNQAKETPRAALPSTSIFPNRAFSIFLFAVVFFSLGNSSNAFLILKATETGIELGWLPLLWIVYNLSATLFSPILGRLSDRLGRKPLIVMAFLVYALLYLCFAFADLPWQIWALFAGYGFYYGLSNGVFKAYVADLVPKGNRGTAYGIFNGAIGAALLPASLLMGGLWDAMGSQFAFLVSAGFSLLGLTVFGIGQIFARPST